MNEGSGRGRKRETEREAANSHLTQIEERGGGNQTGRYHDTVMKIA